MSDARTQIEKSLLSQPLVLFAVATTFINDHLLKHSTYAGFVTGKLSDFAGLFFFPFLVFELLTLTRLSAPLVALVGSSRALFASICALSAAVFSWVKISDLGALAYHAAFANLGIEVLLIQDPGDLSALCMLGLAYWYFVHESERKGYAEQSVSPADARSLERPDYGPSPGHRVGDIRCAGLPHALE